MKEFDFSILLQGDLELNEDFVSALFEAGCDDATVGTSNGKFVLDFTRLANSLEEAISSAMADIQTAVRTIDPNGHAIFGTIHTPNDPVCVS